MKEAYKKIQIRISPVIDKILPRGRKKRSEEILAALDLYCSFHITLYMITNTLTGQKHIGYYKGNEAHDVYWHYVHNLGDRTLGAEIRNGSPALYKFEVIGLFTKMAMAKRVSRFFLEKYKNHLYKSYNVDDNIEVLFITAKDRYKRGKEEQRKI